MGAAHSDAPLFLWNTWHFIQQAQVHDFSLVTDAILFPHTTSLALHTYTRVFSGIALLFHAVSGNLVLSFNLTFLLCSVVSAYAAYRFFFLVSPSRLGAILGGQIFAFQPLWSIYVDFGTQNILSMCCIPLALWLYELGAQHTRFRYIAFFLSGLAVGTAVMNDIYAGTFTLAVIVVYSILRQLLFERITQARWVLAVLGTTFVVCIPYMLQLYTNQEHVRAMQLPTASDVQYYAADPINLLRPYNKHPIAGDVLANMFTDRARSNGNAFFGWTLILFFAVLLVSILRKKFHINTQTQKQLHLFLFGVLFFFLFALGPFLQIAGIQTGIPLPYSWIHTFLPQWYVLRVPMRWYIPLFLFMAGVVSTLFAAMETQSRKRFVLIGFTVLSVGFLIDVAFLPRPLLPINTTHTTLIKQLATTQRTGSVLELPTSIDSGYWSIGDTQDHVAMAHQTLHGRPIITGHMSRLPNAYREMYTSDAVLMYLLHFQSTAPAAAAQSGPAIEAFLQTTQLETIILQKTALDMSSQRTKELQIYIEKDLHFSLNAEDAFTILYTK